MRHDTLELVDAVVRDAGRPTDRRHREYVVNGRKLSRLLPPHGLVSAFGWLDSRVEAEHARMLLLTRPSPLASGRVPLYVCGECANLGCGAITVRVEREEDGYVWKELGRESDAELAEPTLLAPGFEFHFETIAYRTIFQALSRMP